MIFLNYFELRNLLQSEYGSSIIEENVCLAGRAISIDSIGREQMNWLTNLEVILAVSFAGRKH